MTARAPGPGCRLWLRRWARLCLAAVMALALSGCSEDPPDTAEVVTGKTPVVQPEDVHGPGAGGAAVLAPDYRQAMTAGLDGGAGQAAAPGGAAAHPTDPGASRLFAAKGAQSRAAGTAATPLATMPATPSSGAGGSRQGPDGPPAGARAGLPVPGCRQLVLVVAPDFGASRGTLRRFERQGDDAAWREVGAASPCALGRKGLGIGRGLGQPLDGPAKAQGDGRTPAGLFRLPEAFGYAGVDAARSAGVRLPYVAVTDRTACVTEAGSEHFGRVVGPQERTAGGGLRQDRMVRDDRANVWGVVIGHNRDNPDPKAGTCLFLNVRPAGGSPTGGSIGLPESQAAALAAWLDGAAEPVLAVLAEKDYRERRAAWGLPE